MGRLESRREEIEGAVLARVYGVADDPSEVGDSRYIDGFRAAAAAAFDFAIAALERPAGRDPLVPPILLTQARLAARNGVALETVLRRYTAGHAILVNFFAQEIERDPNLPTSELRHALAVGSSAFDRLLAAVSTEYSRDLEAAGDFSQQRHRAEIVARLLAGELLDTADLDYRFDGHHVGIVAEGPLASQALRRSRLPLDCRLLAVSRDDSTIWAWLGTRRRLDAAEVDAVLSPIDGAVFALGESNEGLAGWRLTHRQAMAAFPVAQRQREEVVRYGDVALVSSALKDELLATSLKRRYLEPLAATGDDGNRAIETLRAYMSAGRNLSSAAALLGVNRRTVANRIQRIESKLGQTITDAGPELEVALRLESVGITEPPRNSGGSVDAA